MRWSRMLVILRWRISILSCLFCFFQLFKKLFLNDKIAANSFCCYWKKNTTKMEVVQWLTNSSAQKVVLPVFKAFLVLIKITGCIWLTMTETSFHIFRFCPALMLLSRWQSECLLFEQKLFSFVFFQSCLAGASAINSLPVKLNISDEKSSQMKIVFLLRYFFCKTSEQSEKSNMRENGFSRDCKCPWGTGL